MPNNNKRDFRDGTTARFRMSESFKVIREALSLGELTFGNIMAKTGLSKPALASNLAKLLQKEEIKKREDSADSRLRYYSLTKKGWKEMYKQTLGNVMDVIGEQMAEILAVATEVTALQQSKQDKNVHLPQLSDKGINLFQVFLTGEMYALTAENERTGFLEPLKEFLTEIKMASEGKAIDIESIKNLCNVFFLFELKKERFIDLIEIIKKSKNFEDFKVAVATGNNVWHQSK